MVKSWKFGEHSKIFLICSPNFQISPNVLQFFSKWKMSLFSICLTNLGLRGFVRQGNLKASHGGEPAHGAFSTKSFGAPPLRHWGCKVQMAKHLYIPPPRLPPTPPASASASPASPGQEGGLEISAESCTHAPQTLGYAQRPPGS